MSTKASFKSKSSENQTPVDVYQMITDKIIEGLEKGRIPWKKTWSDCPTGYPQNYLTKREYNGLNLFLLAFNDFDTHFYLTFNQIKELGGHLKKGSKSTPITYWNFVFYRILDGKLVKVAKEDVAALRRKKIPLEVKPFLKYFRVFNTVDVEGVDFNYPLVEPKSDIDKIESCEAILKSYTSIPTIKHGGNQPYYNRMEDYVKMPESGYFDSSDEYYNVLFHELIHSTGHVSRLNREDLMESGGMKSGSYAKEELTAQIGTMFLTHFTGMNNVDTENQQAYINGWITKLKNDKMFIFSASSKARKAVNYMLGKQDEKLDESNEEGGE